MPAAAKTLLAMFEKDSERDQQMERARELENAAEHDVSWLPRRTFVQYIVWLSHLLTAFKSDGI